MKIWWCGYLLVRSDTRSRTGLTALEETAFILETPRGHENTVRVALLTTFRRVDNSAGGVILTS
jgi:hypothetical protein